MKTKQSYLLFALLFLSGFIFALVFTSLNLFSSKETEYSYKTAKNETRYLKSFNKVTPSYPDEFAIDGKDLTAKKTEIKASLEDAGKSAMQFDWFNKIQKEHVFIYVVDLGNLRFTLDIDGGTYSIKDGFDMSKEPSMVIPITEMGLKNLGILIKDGNMSYEDQYLIYNALAKPALEALYRSGPLYLPGDKSMFKFDDLVQIDIPAEKPVMYNGVPLHIMLTAVNVDGQWIVMDGLHGDPDFRLTLTLDDATGLYKSGVYDVRNISSLDDAKQLSKSFLDFLARTTSYVRKDHK